MKIQERLAKEKKADLVVTGAENEFGVGVVVH